jgi:hypothetical protein
MNYNEYLINNICDGLSQGMSIGEVFAQIYKNLNKQQQEIITFEDIKDTAEACANGWFK